MATIFEPPPTYADPVTVDEKTNKGRFSPLWLKWFVDLASVLTNVGGGGGGIVHNLTVGLQGGAANNYYHLTATEHTKLQVLAGITGISATITTAKLTGGGANGSMTFVNGILTASTPAT